MKTKLSLEERFWQKVRKTDDCWVWAGCTNNQGYGQLWNGKKTMRAHRLAYELHVGEIPAGLEIDHLCRNTSCVNPSHLEAVTHQENIRRGCSLKRGMYCKRGHLFTDDNVYFSKNQYGTVRRKCKTCEIHRSREAYRKIKLEQEDD